MSERYVWILGGGVMQVPMVQEAHSRGYRVLLSDRDTHCACRGIADLFIELDVFDSDAHLRYAQSLSIKPQAIVVDAIDCGVTGALLADYYGLPTCGHVAASNAHDKVRMREKLGAEHPIYLSIPVGTNYNDARCMWVVMADDAEIPVYPCVVKPSDNCASRGVTVVKGPDGWEGALANAYAHNRHSPFILVEECLSGEEVATDWFIEHGVALYANGAKRVLGDFGIEVGHINPFIPDNEMAAQVTNAARKLGVTYGPFKVDFIHDMLYGWVILETACRLSGGFDHTHTCPLATGKDIVGAVLDVALGAPVNRARLTPRHSGFAAAYAPSFRAGKITAWQGLDQAYARPGVDYIIPRADKEIAPLVHCANRPLFVIAHGESEGSAWNNAVMGSECIVPIYEGI